MKITFDLEGSDEFCAFFALYAGLRMYKENKQSQEAPNEVFIASAEAYCMLEHLREKYPKMYNDAKAEYDEVYAAEKQPEPNVEKGIIDDLKKVYQSAVSGREGFTYKSIIKDIQVVVSMGEEKLVIKEINDSVAELLKEDGFKVQRAFLGKQGNHSIISGWAE